MQKIQTESEATLHLLHLTQSVGALVKLVVRQKSCAVFGWHRSRSPENTILIEAGAVVRLRCVYVSVDHRMIWVVFVVDQEESPGHNPVVRRRASVVVVVAV